MAKTTRQTKEEGVVVSYDPSLADPVSHGELQEELSSLREAIALLASCMGANVISADNARRLMALIARPHERTERR